MVTINLHNTMTGKKTRFSPIDAKNVRMYVCGPTVYDRSHLGNARPVVVFDTLYRLLRHVYGAEHVTYVRNFTDIDDKINAAAQARKAAGDPRSLEALIRERTDATIAWYHADMDALGALRPSAEPRATDFVPQMVAMIEALMERKNPEGTPYAYLRDGHVLFRVRAYKEYGALSGRSVDDMIAGARVEVAPFKEDPLDFVLWKPSDTDLPGWPSPWGRGRPGWHIECSAMADELLGASFDIHGGGLDLQFPHHENELAQSACAHPHAEFARVWMHNEMLQVEGEKMSKSLGNFFTVRDLLDQGTQGGVIRYVLLGTHYSKPMDWTEQKKKAAETTLAGWLRMTRGEKPDSHGLASIIPSLANDLDTHGALTAMNDLANYGSAGRLRAAMQLLGLDVPDDSPANWFERREHIGAKDSLSIGVSYSGPQNSDLESQISALVAFWANLRTQKNYAEADAFKSRVKLLGIELRAMPSRDGHAEVPLGFELKALEALK